MDWLPSDLHDAVLLGRLALPDGPTPVIIRHGIVHDMAQVAPTVSMLIEQDCLGKAGVELGRVDQVLERHRPLSPIDLQCVKAAGVTFARSTLERVIEERARGDAAAAAAIRARLEGVVGVGIRTVRPGSAEAAALKDALIADGLWSQYLEVAIGPDAEIFTKAPILSTIGADGEIGVRSDSRWNNPEPELVLVADSKERAVGATLGNDVNLRDFEGRSALLLGKAKDNNASGALGPFVRLFDAAFSMDDVRTADLSLTIAGEDGYALRGSSSMREISRDPLELLRQAMSEHQYPDGLVLFLGTLFAPTEDRDVPGQGFTHKRGDVVTIGWPRLGRLRNRVTTCAAAPPWSFGVGELIKNLAERGLLRSKEAS
jgi:fumarylacetoacetate (FAA) hydrolase family protein